MFIVLFSKLEMGHAAGSDPNIEVKGALWAGAEISGAAVLGIDLSDVTAKDSVRFGDSALSLSPSSPVHWQRYETSLENSVRLCHADRYPLLVSLCSSLCACLHFVTSFSISVSR